jgi:hypothetical protein
MKKILSTLLIFLLMTLTLSVMINSTHATTTIVSVSTGMWPSMSGSIIAFVNPEPIWPFVGTLMYYDIANGLLVNTGVPVAAVTSHISISGSIIVFSSSHDGEISYYDISTGTVVNTGDIGYDFAISGSIIALSSPFDSQPISYYDVSKGTTVNTGVNGSDISISGSTIVFVAPYVSGSSNSQEVGYYNISTGAVGYTGISGYGCSISGSLIALVSATPDAHLEYYNIATQQLVDTGIPANVTSISGSTIAFCRSIAGGNDTNKILIEGYHNILTDQTENIVWQTGNISPGSISIDGSIIAFTNQNLIQYVDISQSSDYTQTGTDVTINSVGTGISVTFSEVINPGQTTISTSQSNPGSNLANFQFLGTYSKINTNASFSGPVIVGFAYSPNIPSEDENMLQVLHWDGTSWTNVTDHMDTESNIIYAQVNSFSWFALGFISVKPYVYSGVLQPINVDGSSIFKLRSTVPVKFQLKDDSGNFVGNAEAKIYVAKISDGVSGSEMEAISTSAASTGNNFRYDTASNQYIFNLGTKSLSVGTWQIRIALDDGTSKYCTISLR